MSAQRPLRVVLVKPSKYGLDGYVERFTRGFMPNSTLPHLASLTPRRLGDRPIEIYAVDEYVETDLGYLRLLEFDDNGHTLRVRTYSPSLDVWATGAEQQFDLELSPPLW